MRHTLCLLKGLSRKVLMHDSHSSNFRDEESNAQQKTERVKYEILCMTICQAGPVSPVTEHCLLCNADIFYIIYQPELAIINVRNELVPTEGINKVIRFSKTRISATPGTYFSYSLCSQNLLQNSG